MPSEVWEEITCLFPNFIGCTVEVWEWISIFTPYYTMGMIIYPCLGLRLTHVRERGPMWFVTIYIVSVTYIVQPPLPDDSFSVDRERHCSQYVFDEDKVFFYSLDERMPSYKCERDNIQYYELPYSFYYKYIEDTFQIIRPWMWVIA